jgi:hypothetical protein
LVAVMFHLTSVGDFFVNDHFLQIAGGRQVLGGDLPYRDFVDRGLPFQYYLSALTMWLSGERLFGEALVCLLLISAGVAVAYFLSLRVSGSAPIALTATALLLLLAPRPYNYQKAFFLPLGVLFIWRYIDRPSRGNAIALSAFTAIAFLFRHDLAVFVGAGAVSGVLLANGRNIVLGLRHAALYAVGLMLFLAPFWLFVALNGGLLGYFAEGVEMSASQQNVTLFTVQPRFVVLTGVPLLSFATGTPGGGVSVPRVEFPALADTRNAIAWLFWSMLLWPLGALLLVAYDRVRGKWRPTQSGTVTTTSDDMARIVSVAVLALIALPPLLRNPFDVRLPDVAPFCIIPGAWLLSQYWQRSATPPGARPLLATFDQAAARSLAVGIVLLTLVSAVALSDLRSGRNPLFRGVDAVLAEVPEQARALNESSYRRGAIGGYVASCTRPDDKVLFAWFAPELYFYTRRRFAAGQPYFYGDIGASLKAQELMVSRMSRESVPVIVENTNAYLIEKQLPVVAAYVQSNYEFVGEVDERGVGRLRVWAHRRSAATGRFRPLDLPCFA